MNRRLKLLSILCCFGHSIFFAMEKQLQVKFNGKDLDKKIQKSANKIGLLATWKTTNENDNFVDLKDLFSGIDEQIVNEDNINDCLTWSTKNENEFSSSVDELIKDNIENGIERLLTLGQTAAILDVRDENDQENPLYNKIVDVFITKKLIPNQWYKNFVFFNNSYINRLGTLYKQKIIKESTKEESIKDPMTEIIVEDISRTSEGFTRTSERYITTTKVDYEKEDNLTKEYGFLDVDNFSVKSSFSDLNDDAKRNIQFLIEKHNNKLMIDGKSNMIIDIIRKHGASYDIKSDMLRANYNNVKLHKTIPAKFKPISPEELSSKPISVIVGFLAKKNGPLKKMQQECAQYSGAGVYSLATSVVASLYSIALYNQYVLPKKCQSLALSKVLDWTPEASMALGGLGCAGCMLKYVYKKVDKESLRDATIAGGLGGFYGYFFGWAAKIFSPIISLALVPTSLYNFFWAKNLQNKMKEHAKKLKDLTEKSSVKDKYIILSTPDNKINFKNESTSTKSNSGGINEFDF